MNAHCVRARDFHRSKYMMYVNLMLKARARYEEGLHWIDDKQTALNHSRVSHWARKATQAYIQYSKLRHYKGE